MDISRFIIVTLSLVAYTLAAPNDFPKPSHFNHGIIGGQEAERGEFPHQVSIQIHFEDGYVLHMCGGSIIASTWVLSAGHCTFKVVGTVKVIAGILNLDDGDDIDTKQVLEVRRTIVHELYPNDNTVAPNDISLIEVETPFVWNDAVQPIALAVCGTETTGEALLSGWGATENNLDQNTLLKVTLSIIENAECKESLDDVLGPDSNPFDADSNLCTGQIGAEEGPCNGDSGGGLLQDGRVVGIVSWAVMPCGQRTSVYTKVSNFCDWIEDHTNGTVIV